MDSFNSAQRAVLEQMAAGTPLPQVLGAIVKLVEQQAKGMLCSILLLDPARKTLHHGAAPSLPPAYIEALDGSEIGREAGSCGAAAFSGERVVVEDIASHPYWVPYRELAARYELCACWSTPISSPEREVLGTFAMYYRECRAPRADELEWVSIATHLAAIAIVRDRVEQKRRENEARLRVLNELGEAMRATSDPDQALPLALQLLGRHLGVSRCVYADVDPDGDLCRIPHEYTDGAPSILGEHRLSSFDPIMSAEVKRGGPAVVVRDVGSEIADPGAVQLLTAMSISAFVSCSLVRHGALRALMSVTHHTPRDWSEDEIVLVQDVVERCWAAIEQRAAEAKLRHNEALLRIAGRAAKLGGWSLELPEFRVSWSDEVCAVHDVPAGTVPSFGQAIAYYAPEFHELIRESVLACARDGTPFDLELQLITAKERRIWVRSIGYAERNTHGAIACVQGAFQDISDRKNLEDQLRQSQKMQAIGKLAGGIAHDFNNLLTVILSYTSLIVDGLAQEDPLRADLDEIRAAGERAGELTRQLLAFSRQQVLKPRVLDLNQVIGGLEKMLRRLLGADIEIAFLPRPLGQVLADPGQIEQVIVNLAVNARDAMPAGGRLLIETADVELDAAYAATQHGVVPGKYAMIAVKDNGIGMDAMTRLRIFEPFFTTKEKGKGTGLGLSTVWGIVTQSGGHVLFESEPGSGTTFKVFLPQVDQPVDLKRLPSDKPMTLRGSETVLVVEDEVQVRGLVRSILGRNGYNVLEAPDGVEALVLCERYSAEIHLLLTDVVMPRMGGRELAERVRPMRPEMRILFMSGYTEDAIVHQGILESQIAFLSKPLTPSALLRKVREVLDAPV